jgi:hypothetical protein
MTLTARGSRPLPAPHPGGWGGPDTTAHGRAALAALPHGMYVLGTTETAGPYGLHALLTAAALQRHDITEGHAGIPLMLALQLVDYDNQCAPLHGAEVGIWHCNAQGIYADAEAGETFLRGVQYTNHAGCVAFKTILPGSHPMQQARIHVQITLPSEVPSSRTVSTASGQLCFPHTVRIAACSHPTLYRPEPHAGASTPRWEATERSAMLAIGGDVRTGYRASSVIGVTSAPW